MYTFGSLNIAGEGIIRLSHEFTSCLEDGAAGQDVQETLVGYLQRLDESIPEYLDMKIGYLYYSLDWTLTRQETYSDILIKDCNTYCI